MAPPYPCNLTPTSLDAANTTSILREFGGRWASACVESLGNSGGFSGARLWRVTSAAGDYCLRAAAAAKWDPSRLRGLHRLLKHVHDAGVTVVPVPIAAVSGETLIERGGELWQLEPWMPGIADFDRHPTDERLAAAMTCLARWHLAAGRFVASDVEHEWFACAAQARSPAVIERREKIQTWSATHCDDARRRLTKLDWPNFRTLGERLLRLFEQHAPHVARELELAARIAVPVQPCLRDIWHDHVLFAGAKVSGLIDANACRTESVATDLARLLGSLVGDDRRRWRFAIEVYQIVRSLSVAEQGLIEVLDQSGVLLNGLTWLTWACVEQRSFAEQDRGRIEQRLSSHLERLERLNPCAASIASRDL